MKHRRQRMRQENSAMERERLEQRLASGSVSPIIAAGLRSDYAVRAAATRGLGYWVAARKQAFDRNVARSKTDPNSGLRLLLARIGGDSPAWDAQPRLVDFEDSFGPVIDELEPDLIHANDADMLGVAARAVVRARSRGRDVKLVYDAHEFFPGEIRHGDASWHVVMAGEERRYLPLVDGVCAAAEHIATAMAECYQLSTVPTVVNNMPERSTLVGVGEEVPGVRGDLELDADVPLIVHAGMVAPVRGLDAIVRALAEPGMSHAHFAMLVGSRQGHVADLVGLAESLDCGERLHLLDYVPVQELTAYLATATVGVEPFLHTPHQELTVTTKFWSYLNARLPIVVSDVKAMSGLVGEMGNGEVFVAGDAQSAAAALRKVFENRERYTAVYEADGPEATRFTWEPQAERMLALYQAVMHA
ncbi:glycosyltransferase [Catenulispora acidiphila]|uniref:glycosyltransferase n=1 Tax=Catenulispora acidiphila TaxID=304895 RepID=UPI0002D4876E|nr:glycosyltransferase [Catenulispora acidiphila]